MLEICFVSCSQVSSDPQLECLLKWQGFTGRPAAWLLLMLTVPVRLLLSAGCLLTLPAGEAVLHGSHGNPLFDASG
jgi:hypothetical protein